MSAERRRRRIFQAGTEALQAVSEPDGEDLYGCPLCRRLFDAQALAGPDPTLTLEHVPPRYLGGREIVLTCKRCNSEGGQKLDAEAAARREFVEAVRALVYAKGSYRGKGTWWWGDERLAGELIVRGSNVRLNVVGKATDPQAGPRARARIMDQQRRGEQVTMRLRPEISFRLRESQLGDLRTAYLVAFAAFGYSYVFHPRLHDVREQLTNPGQEIVAPGFWGEERDAPPDRRRLFLSDDPLVAIVQLGRVWVFLPTPDSPPDAVGRAADVIASGGRLTGRVWRWPRDPEFLVDKRREAEKLPPLFRLVTEQSGGNT